MIKTSLSREMACLWLVAGQQRQHFNAFVAASGILLAGFNCGCCVQGPEADAESATLAPVDAGPLEQRVRVKLDVSGELFASAGRGEESVRQPIEVSARFDFMESKAQELPAVAREAATRRYLDATAEIRVDGKVSRTVLANDARMLMVARLGTTAVPFLAEAFLSRDELDFLETPFDSLLLDELLPKGPVAVGESWQISGDVTAGLLAIDTVENGVLEATLKETGDGRAQVSLAGIVDGAADGVPTHVVVEGTFTVPVSDVADSESLNRTHLAGPVATVSVVLRERRQASHVAAGFEVEARLSVSRTSQLPANTSQSDAAADSVANEVVTAQESQSESLGSQATQEKVVRRQGVGQPETVWHSDQAGRYDLVHDQRWRIVEDGPSGLVMRLIDCGALVGQCSITALPRADADVTPAIAEVQRDIQRSLAGQFRAVQEATETTLHSTATDPIKMVRVVSDGTAENLSFRWIHCILWDTQGRRVSITFMLEASMQKRFGVADRELVEGLRFVTTDSASKPAAAKEARLPR